MTRTRYVRIGSWAEVPRGPLRWIADLFVAIADIDRERSAIGGGPVMVGPSIQVRVVPLTDFLFPQNAPYRANFRVTPREEA